MKVNNTTSIRAAGGVVTRKGRRGALEVLLVHRPSYRDWTFPKGKADEGERWRETALREVEEETGYTCALQHKLPVIHYRDRKDRHKEVRYWAMKVVSGSFSPNDEVDQIEWLTIGEAKVRLTYDRDVALLDALRELIPA